MDTYNSFNFKVPVQNPIDINKFNNGEYEFTGDMIKLKDPEHEIQELAIETINFSNI